MATPPSSTYQPPYWPPVKRPPHRPVPETITADSRIAMEALDAVETFALGPVGIMASPNRGETITRDLAAHPDAIEAFAWLASHGAPVARLYAYWALRTLAPERAQPYAAALEADQTTIETMSGCLLDMASVGSIALRMNRRNDVVGRAMPKP